MRPRVFPAENKLRRTRYILVLNASMRPRVFPAENTRSLGVIRNA